MQNEELRYIAYLNMLLIQEPIDFPEITIGHETHCPVFLFVFLTIFILDLEFGLALH